MSLKRPLLGMSLAALTVGLGANVAVAPAAQAAPAVAPAQVAIDAVDTHGGWFGFKTSGYPYGTTMHVTWRTADGQAHTAATTAWDWWSGDQGAWTDAHAVITDTAGVVYGRSMTLRPTTQTMTITARADLVDATGARMTVRVNGQNVATTSVTATVATDYRFAVPAGTDLATASVDVLFDNDAYWADGAGTHDRNLYVQRIALGGESFGPEAMQLDRGDTMAAATDGVGVTPAPADGRIASNGAIRLHPTRGAAVATDRIFSPTSALYRTLPADAPLAPDNASIMSAVIDAGFQAYGTTRYYEGAAHRVPSLTPNISKFGNPLVTAHNTDPAYDIAFEDCQHKGWTDPSWLEQMRGVHIPDSALPAPGSDHQLSIWNADTGRLTELWVARKVVGGWTACWGGSIADSRTAEAHYPNPYGSPGSGLTINGYTVTVEELRRGEINHPVAMVLPPSVVNDHVSGLATRTDGTEPANGSTMAEGQYMRLPADLDIDALAISPTAKILAHAAQRYGFILSDRGGAWTFQFQQQAQFAQDPYPELFGGLPDYAVLWGDESKGERPFPFEKLQVVREGYVPPA